MILTITPNPSLDLLFEAERLVWDDANRVGAPRIRPGGQGVNVTRAARALGGSSVAIAVLGGRTGDELERMLAAEATPCQRVQVDQETRTFIGVREIATGRSLLINPRGPQLSAQEAAAMLREISSIITAQRPAWVATCGSLPPGVPDTWYQELGTHARGAGARFVVDCDGPALQLAAPLAHLLVPNRFEAERLTGYTITDEPALAAALRRLLEIGCDAAAITLGPEGAALANPREAWVAEPPVTRTGSTVGAGDSFLAALLLKIGEATPLDQALRFAAAAGTAALHGRGRDLIRATDVEALLPKTKVRRLF